MKALKKLLIFIIFSLIFLLNTTGAYAYYNNLEALYNHLPTVYRTVNCAYVSYGGSVPYDITHETEIRRLDATTFQLRNVRISPSREVHETKTSSSFGLDASRTYIIKATTSYGDIVPEYIAFDPNSLTVGGNWSFFMSYGTTSNNHQYATYEAFSFKINTNVCPGFTVANASYNRATDSIDYSVSAQDGNGDPLNYKIKVDGITSYTTASPIGSINASGWPEGNYNVTFWVDDIYEYTTLTVPVNLDREPPHIENVNISSTSSSVSMTGSATDTGGLDAAPYRYTIGTSPATAWTADSSYTLYSLLPNTQYATKFEARDQAGHIASNSNSIYTKAEVPGLSKANPSSYTLDILTDDNNSSITQYQICLSDGTKYVAQDGSLTDFPAWITLPGKSITVTGLSPNHTYSFKARAKNEEGIETSFSSEVSGTTLEAPPGSPGNIIATADESSITVSWDPVAGSASYDIEADGVVISTGSETAYTHSGLTPNTQHTYRIRAINTGGTGNWSAPVTKSTRPVSPTEPLNINAAATDTKVIVTWEAVPGATGYDIEVDGQVHNNSSSTNYVHTGLLPGTTHSYRVRSINAGGKSSWSNEVLVTTQVGTPSVPYNIETETSKTQIKITWEGVPGATGYDIELDSLIADAGNNTSYTHYNLVPGTEHSYRVRAKASGVEGDWSPMVTTATLLDVFGTPANFKAEITDTTVTLTWENVTEATEYDIEADGTELDNGNEVICVIGNLEPNSSHMYRVRAKKADEISDWSEYISVTTYSLPAPEDFTSFPGQDSVGLSWSPVEGAESYDIKFDESFINDITETNYIVEGLNPGTRHTAYVRAVNEDGYGTWSLPLLIVTGSGNNTGKGIMFKVSKNSIGLIWDEIDEATGYDVEADGVVTSNILSANYQDNGLQTGSTHTYRIRPIYAEGTGDWSGLITITTISDGPSVPANVNASATINSVLVTWGVSENAVEYEIEADGQIIDAGVGTRYTDMSLPAGSQHTYRVRAKSAAAQYSAWSEPVSITTASSTKTYTLEGTEGEVFNLVLSASNLDNLGERTFTVTYDTEELEVVDLCGTTPRIDLSAGNIVGTDVQVVQFEPGTIVLKKIGNFQAGQSWLGIVDSIKFRAKESSAGTIIYLNQ